MREVRELAAPAVQFVKRRRDPVAVQTLRSTAAATVAYVIAVRLSPEAAPLTAPLTALLVVQVTLFSTLTTGVRRVNAVVAGVVVAILFSLLAGLTWWSLGLLILASLLVGHLVRVNEFVPEVAISAMLVLGVTHHGDTAWARIVETLIGAVVGMAFNLLLAPPVWVEEAGDSIVGLARQVRQLMLRIGEEAAGRTPVDRAVARLHEARRLDHDIIEVDAALRQAEDSLKLNPRVREGLLHRVVLRTGLDTLEICTVVLRVLARTLKIGRASWREGVEESGMVRAEDGIRDFHVTGVQTCALPIWLHEARRLDHDIIEVDAALRQAEDSLKLNPRVREGLLHRVVLRTGLDTLEICTVVLRVLARTLTDLAKERETEPLFEPETGATLAQLLSEIADAVVSFAVLVTTSVSSSAESAEERLAAELR